MSIFFDELLTPAAKELASVLGRCPKASSVLMIVANAGGDEAILEMQNRTLYLKEASRAMLIIMEKVFLDLLKMVWKHVILL